MIDTIRAPMGRAHDNDRGRPNCAHQTIEADAELVLVEQRRLTHDGGKIPHVIPDPEHPHRKRRESRSVSRQGVGETPAISHLLVYAVDRGDVVRLGSRHRAGFSGAGRKRHTVFSSRRPSVPTRRAVRRSPIGPEMPGSLAIAATIRAPPFTSAQTQPCAKDQSQTNPQKHIDVGAQPDRRRHDQRRA